MTWHREMLPHVMTDLPTDVLFIGGRSGVGKTSVAAEIGRQLTAADVWHALKEGDNLTQAPNPGYHRLIYTNTVSVLEMDNLVNAIGGDVTATGILLTASDKTAAERLTGREIGSGLSYHLEASKRGADRLAATASDQVHRVATDARSIAAIASEILSLTAWLVAR